LQNYFDAETPDKKNHIKLKKDHENNIQELELHDKAYIENFRDKNYSPITNERAAKLRRNILTNKELYQYHHIYHLKKDVIKEIKNEFENEEKLVWDIIEIPEKINKTPIITFALGAENSTERMLVLDVDKPIDITNKFVEYQLNFENNSAKIFDKNFFKNGFSDKNTRTIYIKNDDSLKELYDITLQNDINELYLETCIISYDLIDLITGISPYNFFNSGQFSFFERVTDDMGNTIFSTVTKDVNQDVNPTRPPY